MRQEKKYKSRISNVHGIPAYIFAISTDQFFFLHVNNVHIALAYFFVIAFHIRFCEISSDGINEKKMWFISWFSMRYRNAFRPTLYFILKYFKLEKKPNSLISLNHTTVSVKWSVYVLCTSNKCTNANSEHMCGVIFVSFLCVIILPYIYSIYIMAEVAPPAWKYNVWMETRALALTSDDRISYDSHR